LAKRPGQQIVATAALIMGIAIGLLTVGLGLELAVSPWDPHFAAHRVAAILTALVGLSYVAVGLVIVIDLVAGGPRPRHRH
jgi:hypothetical protein